jgi:hypothetical protein
MRTREPVYWFEREKVERLGYCDESVPCTEGFSMVHQCSRAEGHNGQHATRTWTNGSVRVEKA